MIWCVVEKGLCSPPRLTSGEINFPSLLGKMPNRNPSLFVDVNGEISQNQDFSVEVNQERYSEGISENQITNQRKLEADQPITEGERKQLRAVLGALSWRSTQSAPWLCASVSFLQGCMKNAVVQDLIDVNKLVRTQRQYNNVPLYFLSNIEKPMLVTFHNASWASRKDMSSQGGLLTVLTDESVMTDDRSGEVVLTNCMAVTSIAQGMQKLHGCRSANGQFSH